jgi:enoyl reductase-like protein
VTVEDLGDMTYEETVLRPVRLMYVTQGRPKSAGSIYLCATSQECAMSKIVPPA